MTGYATDQDFLQHIREQREHAHYFRACHSARSHLRLSVDLPLPLLVYERVMDLGNKTTAIYGVGPNSTGLSWVSYIFDYVYQAWLRPYRSDLEFARFLAHILSVQDGERLPETGEIIAVHHALCQQADSFEANKDQHPKPYMGHTGYLLEESSHFRLQPLFRAIIILFDAPKISYKGFEVRIVRTGIEDHLSSPISFHSIQDKSQGYNGDGSTEVTTDLASALEFVLDLERREAAAYPTFYADESIFDRYYGDPNPLARRKHYCGGEIRGPSTTWVTGQPQPKTKRMCFTKELTS